MRKQTPIELLLDQRHICAGTRKKRDNKPYANTVHSRKNSNHTKCSYIYALTFRRKVVSVQIEETKAFYLLKSLCATHHHPESLLMSTPPHARTPAHPPLMEIRPSDDCPTATNYEVLRSSQAPQAPRLNTTQHNTTHHITSQNQVSSLQSTSACPQNNRHTFKLIFPRVQMGQVAQVAKRIRYLTLQLVVIKHQTLQRTASKQQKHISCIQNTLRPLLYDQHTPAHQHTSTPEPDACIPAFPQLRWNATTNEVLRQDQLLQPR